MCTFAHVLGFSCGKDKSNTFWAELRYEFSPFCFFMEKFYRTAIILLYYIFSYHALSLYTTTEEFECIARKQRPDLLEVRRAFFDNADDAEDVAQRMLLRLWLVRTRIDAQFSINTRVPAQSKSISFEEYSQKNR
jgi:hypothetical protein